MTSLKLVQVEKVTASQAASEPGDYTRLQEVAQALSGVSPRGHLHVSSEVTDFAGAVGVIVAAAIAAIPPAPTLDPSGISRPGHHHAAADVTDFAAATAGVMAARLAGSASVDWANASGTLQATVRRAATGALVETPDGLGVDLGTGPTQAAAGNHTHGQLHAAATVTSGTTVQLQLTGQDITAEAILGAGVQATASGIEVNFGTGHGQAARGDHTHANQHAALTVQGSDSLALYCDGTQALSGTVRLDGSPPANRGRLEAGANGLRVVLGGASDTAAAGNHGHSAATTLSDGFMSAADKARLDALGMPPTRVEALRVVLDGHGSALAAGLAEYAVMEWSGTVTGWEVVAAAAGNLVVDVKRSSWAGFPTGTSIAGMERPTLGGARLSRDLDLTSWGGYGPGDVLIFEVVSGSGIARAMVQLRLERA